MERWKKAAIAGLAFAGTGTLLYLSGLLAQAYGNYRAWLGASGEAVMAKPDWGLLPCLRHAITPDGLRALAAFLAVGVAAALYVRLHDVFDGRDKDPRGFKVSGTGEYGTAGWMTEGEVRAMLEVTTPGEAEGVILGTYRGRTVCMPRDTRLNRHIAIFGASGTMKSRAVIRNALFQAIRRGESVVATDPKAELYNDTSEMFRRAGYEVKVFNLVDPAHGDSWNCMSDLNGSTLMAQMLTNIIIGNTGGGKGDHFWDNGEGNLLKALILLVDLDPSRTQGEKHLPAVYRMLTGYSERQLTAMFEKLPMDHPARGPYSLFAQSSDTVKSGIIQGLGTRLQVLQNREVQDITRRADIDLAAPGRKKCAYYMILSDQDATMAFLSSLFFSLMFLKLTRLADTSPGGKCAVPGNLVLDEFNNVGRIGGAADGSDFARALSVIRSRDIRVMMAVQSLGQLQNRYGDNLWAELIGNCDIQLMLGCTDDVTAAYFSARSGEMSIEVGSTMTTRRTVAVAQVIPEYRQTQGQGRRMLLTPDEVLRLPNTELLCVIRGCNILKLEKLDYTRHPMSREMVRTSIMDYRPQGNTGRDGSPSSSTEQGPGQNPGEGDSGPKQEPQAESHTQPGIKIGTGTQGAGTEAAGKPDEGQGNKKPETVAKKPRGSTQAGKPSGTAKPRTARDSYRAAEEALLRGQKSGQGRTAAPPGDGKSTVPPGDGKTKTGGGHAMPQGNDKTTDTVQAFRQDGTGTQARKGAPGNTGVSTATQDAVPKGQEDPPPGMESGQQQETGIEKDQEQAPGKGNGQQSDGGQGNGSPAAPHGKLYSLARPPEDF